VLDVSEQQAEVAAGMIGEGVDGGYDTSRASPKN